MISLCLVLLPALAGSASAFTLQLLHASDLEGGVDAIQTAPNFAAIVEDLEGDYANTVIISAGDNYLPGPFLSAQTDRAAFRDSGLFNDVYNELFGVSDYDGLREGAGRVDISIMNVIGFDASAIGNHEFDLGSDTFENAIEEDFRSPNGPAADRWVGAQFPYLSANLDFSGDGDLSNLFTSQILSTTDFATGPAESTAGNSSVPKLAQAAIFNVGGEQIGVIGGTTQRLNSISSPSGSQIIGATDNDIPVLAAQIQAIADDMTNNLSINKIIVVTHLQDFNLETQLAGLLTNVDIIIAGGSDFLLSDSGDTLRAGDTSDGQYPTVVNGIALVSTDGEYSYVGRLIVEFDASGNIITDFSSAASQAVSGPVLTTDTEVMNRYGNLVDPFLDGTKGGEVKKLVDPLVALVTAQDANVFGESTVFIEGRREFVRTEETNMGNITADANLWYAQSIDPNAVFSLKNGGGIRNPIGEVDSMNGTLLPTQANPLSGKEEGEISQLDIANTLRFNNALSLITLTAAEMKEVLEHSVAASGPGSTPGQFPQIAGISFSYDVGKPVGSRVQSAAIVDGSGNVIDTIIRRSKVVGDASRAFRGVTLNFLAGGGDAYPFPSFPGLNRVDLNLPAMTTGAAIFADDGTEQDALAEYLDLFFPAVIGVPVVSFDDAETPASADLRIQNVDEKADEVPGGFTDDGVFNRDDLFVIQSFIGKPKALCTDCDVNNDGVINFFDVRVAGSTLCTNPRCQ